MNLIDNVARLATLNISVEAVQAILRIVPLRAGRTHTWKQGVASSVQKQLHQEMTRRCHHFRVIALLRFACSDNTDNGQITLENGVGYKKGDAAMTSAIEEGWQGPYKTNIQGES